MTKIREVLSLDFTTSMRDPDCSKSRHKTQNELGGYGVELHSLGLQIRPYVCWYSNIILKDI